MKVTYMESNSLETKVLNELKALRKHRNGASFEGLSVKGKTICSLLGAGDAALAYNVLVQQCLEKIGSDWGMEIEAAITVLGLASEQETVLGRLEEFAAKYYLDQRQARRYSDQGLVSLAKLIATTWSVYSVPIAQVVVNTDAPINCRISRECQAHVNISYADSIEMRIPEYEIDGSSRSELKIHEKRLVNNNVSLKFLPIRFCEIFDLFWFGEMWPKWEVMIFQDSGTIVETLGAHLRVGNARSCT